MITAKESLMKISICDDNIEILDFLEQEIFAKYNDFFTITRYSDTDELLKDWKSTHHHADIVIMDIKFQHRNGVDAAKEIQEKYGTHIKIIFITGYPEHASEIFRAQPTFLLMKPLSKELLYEALEKARDLIQEENDRAVYISFRGCTKRIKVNDIYHIESIRKKVVLHHIDGIEETIQKLNEIEKLLPDYFLRIHQSFLVNMNYIKSISAYTLETTNGFSLPISRSKSKYARERFMEFLSMNN